MKVWKQKMAAAVLAGMLLGAGCTEELDPRPPSAELTEEERNLPPQVLQMLLQNRLDNLHEGDHTND